MSKELILHIGTHKTGTTTLQRHLVGNEEALNNGDIGLFHTHHLSWQEVGNFNQSLKRDLHKSLYKYAWPEGLSTAIGTTPGRRVIASCEELCWIFDPLSIKQIAAELGAYFSKVTVVVFLRRQDKHALSSHVFGKQESSLPQAGFHGNGASPLPDMQDDYEHYYDYSRLVGRWADAFGDENMVIKIFEPNKLHAGDVVADFIHSFELPLEHSATIRNVGTSRVQFKLNCLLARSGLNPTHFRGFIRSIEDDEQPLPSRAEAEAFYQQYASSNIALNQRFNISNDDDIFDLNFNDYPISSNALWSSELSTKAASELFKAAEKIQPIDDIQLAIDVARNLEQTHPAIALAFLRLCLKQHPDAERLNTRILSIENDEAIHA